MTETASIKWLRVNAGLTQQQAAAAIGVSRVTFNRWENGQTPVPPLKLARFQKVLASNTAFEPPVHDAPTAGPSKAFLRAEYDRLKKWYDALTADENGNWSDEDEEKYYEARDAWFRSEHGGKWLVVLYEDEAARDMAEYQAPRENVVPRPENWLTEFKHYAETPAYKAFVKAYGLDLL